MVNKETVIKLRNNKGTTKGRFYYEAWNAAPFATRRGQQMNGAPFAPRRGRKRSGAPTGPGRVKDKKLSPLRPVAPPRPNGVGKKGGAPRFSGAPTPRDEHY